MAEKSLGLKKLQGPAMGFAMLLAHFCVLFCVLFRTHAAQASHEFLAPGLKHLEYRCQVHGHTIDLEELRMEPGQGLEIRAIQNPTAVRNPRCRSDYGGLDLEALLKSRPPKNFEVLGATNGTLFRVVGERYASNHLLWSRDAGLIAPLRRQGGTHVIVVDHDGGHALGIHFERCGAQYCARHEGHRYKAEAFVEALRKAYPSMTLAMQNNMPLTGDTRYAACKKDPQGQALNGGDWRCRSLMRTVICLRHDHSISLIATRDSGALPEDLAAGLRAHGACHAECESAFNLDGGGSTQLGYAKKDMGFVLNGSRMETSQPGCSSIRPVDNYLVIGKISSGSRTKRP
jgi:hypothetical protein